jgi:hypothetical protein
MPVIISGFRAVVFTLPPVDGIVRSVRSQDSRRRYGMNTFERELDAALKEAATGSTEGSAGEAVVEAKAWTAVMIAWVRWKLSVADEVRVGPPPPDRVWY